MTPPPRMRMSLRSAMPFVIGRGFRVSRAAFFLPSPLVGEGPGVRGRLRLSTYCRRSGVEDRFEDFGAVRFPGGRGLGPGGAGRVVGEMGLGQVGVLLLLRHWRSLVLQV